MKRIKEEIQINLSADFTLPVANTRIGNLFFVIPLDDIYSFELNLFCYIPSGTGGAISWFINGVQVPKNVFYVTSASGVQYEQLTKTLTKKFKAGDIVEAKGSYSGSSASYIESDSGSYLKVKRG